MASAHFSGLNQESHTYHSVDIPECLKSNTSAQAIKTRNRIFQISSTSQSVNSGGLILFNLPPSNYTISRGTMALRMRVKVTGVGFGASPATVSFQGPFTNPSGGTPGAANAYSVFQRMTLYGSNSSILEQINYANDQMNLLLNHNSNPTFLINDGSILIGYGADMGNNSATEAQIDVVIPLPFSCFNSTTQDFPAYLLSSPLTIQLDLASVARAIFKGSGATSVSEYNISNTYLVYQAVELPNELISAERQALKSSPFIMNCTSSLNVQVPMSVLSSYTLGLNASSLRSVFIMPTSVASYASATPVNYARNTTDGSPFYGAGVSNILYLDGCQVNSALYDNLAMVYYGLKGALHHDIQGSVLFPSVGNVAGFYNSVYAIGWDCSSFNDESCIFGGSPVTSINIQLIGTSGGASTYLATIVCIYDVLVAFESDGSMSIKR